jgi:hypothetical protein
MSRLFVLVIPVLLVGLLGCVQQADVKVTPPQPPAVVVAIDPTESMNIAPMPREVAIAPMPREIIEKAVAPLPHEPTVLDLTIEDIGIEPLPGIVDRIEDLKVPGPIPHFDLLNPFSPSPTGLALPGNLVAPPLGLNPDIKLPGLPAGTAIDDLPMNTKLVPRGAFDGRRGETKATLLKQFGGNEASEKAVELALAWLARQQMKDGGWEFDQGSKECKVAATGLVLLAFLGAGETHKDEKGKYKAVVEKGLQYLQKLTPANGPNAGRLSTNMYEQAIGTMALVEAYGITKDKELKPYAQAAISYIQRVQGPNGSWGYGPSANGDTSIVGWQIQALKAAQLTKDLIVDDRVIKKATKFLDLAAGGSRKSMYGYADDKGAAPGTPLTAVGLLCRYYIDAWGPSHPGMIDGVAGLVKHPPLDKGDGKLPAISNMYYYYYATQVVRFYGREDWKTWNEGPKSDKGIRKGGMRDWLVGQQVKKEGLNLGSWDPEMGWFGTSCGRIGTTAMCTLTLEVYYRYLPLYREDGPAANLLEKKDPDPKK